jgi:hypothetical protein
MLESKIDREKSLASMVESRWVELSPSVSKIKRTVSGVSWIGVDQIQIPKGGYI